MRNAVKVESNRNAILLVAPIETVSEIQNQTISVSLLTFK
jgi:hypothetical protein